MKRLSKNERIKAAMAGSDLDRVPISLWQHFPWADQNPKDLAETQLAFHKKFDLDFIKVMPYGLYSTTDYKMSEIEFYGGFEPPVVSKYGVKSIGEWERIKPLNPYEGAMGEQLKCLEYINEGLKGEAPFLQTVFSPLTTLAKIAGGRLLQDLKEDPKLMHEVLEVVTDTTVKFAEACVDLGAGGVFFATQFATTELMDEETYRTFGLAYDKKILEAIEGDSWFNIYHLHGLDIMTDIVKDLNVECVSWHDRRTQPNLKEGLDIFEGKCLVGGINETKTIMDGTLMTITDEIHDAIEQTKGKRLIVGPGCVNPTRTPHMNYYATRMAVETYGSINKTKLLV